MTGYSKSVYRHRKPSHVGGLVREGDVESTRTITKYVVNGFNKVRFGQHNARGIFGACPGEILHLITLGWFKYCLESFAHQAGAKKEKKSAALEHYDALYADIGSAMNTSANTQKRVASFTRQAAHRYHEDLAILVANNDVDEFEAKKPPILLTSSGAAGRRFVLSQKPSSDVMFAWNSPRATDDSPKNRLPSRISKFITKYCCPDVPRGLAKSLFRESLRKEIGTEAIQTIMGNIAPAGQLLRCLVAWAQYGVGTSKPLLDDVTTKLPHMESRWLASLRDYLASIRASLQLDITGVANLEREHDKFIMDCIIDSGHFSPNEIKKLNYCRMYLGAILLSELTTTGGDRLDAGKLYGNVSLFSTKSKWLNVHQELPNEAAWKIWKKANALWSRMDGTMLQPLGSWLVRPITQSRIQHFAYATTKKLYIRTSEGEFKVCDQERRQTFKESNELIKFKTFLQVPLQSKSENTAIDIGKYRQQHQFE
ncbi:hypothetical protein MHU86_11543 [Fragilaria crotonensis]|nr:hypothetical protein MHU86_11543 [Fragilaria crotonensis]